VIALLETRDPQLPYALSEHGLSTVTTPRYKLLAANQKLCYYFKFQLWIILPNIITLIKKGNEMGGARGTDKREMKTKFCVFVYFKERDHLKDISVNWK